MNEKISAYEFLQTNVLTAIEIVKDDNLLINLVCGEVIYGLDVDTSNITAGTSIERTTNFTVNDTILEYNNKNIDLTSVYML